MLPLAEEKTRSSQKERKELRAVLIGENAQNALEFQNRAVSKFGAAAGIFVRQLVFWDGERSAAGDGWMWKSRREMERETGLNQRHQEEARGRLREAGVLEEDVRPVGPLKRPTLHYKPDLNALLDLLYPTHEAVSTTGHGAEGDNPAYLSEKPPVEVVSTTGHSSDGDFPAYLSGKTPVEAVSSTGYEAEEDHSAYLSGKPRVGAVSTIQESTSGEDDEKEPHLSPRARETARRCLSVLEEMDMSEKNRERVADTLPDLLVRYPDLTNPMKVCRDVLDFASQNEVKDPARLLAKFFDTEDQKVQLQPKNRHGAGTPVFRAPEPEPEGPSETEGERRDRLRRKVEQNPGGWEAQYLRVLEKLDADAAGEQLCRWSQNRDRRAG